MGERQIRLLIAGGGTGGHVLPALAVIEELRERGCLGETLWIGSAGGIEQEAAAGADINFRVVQTGKLRRYLSPRTLIDAVRIPIGVWQARRIVRSFRPDVVFSTGGFVSVPSVAAARRIAPILAHEQTAVLGLANKLNARFAQVLAVSYDATVPIATEYHDRVIVTGNPVRASLAAGDPARAFAHWSLRPEPPLLYVTGGARGASPLNQRLAALLPDLLEHCQIVHQTGPAGANRDAEILAVRRETWSPHLRTRYHIVEFVRDELADLYAAAALVLGRAGAGTVAELAYLGKPALLIPLPGAGGDEQTRNAQLLSTVGAAIVLPQVEATPDRLRTELTALLGHPDRLRRMGEAARGVGRADAASRLADELISLAMWRDHAAPAGHP